MIALRCDQDTACDKPITHIDNKGFVYCTPHGQQRQRHVPCRKLTTTEIAKLGRGETIAYRRGRSTVRQIEQLTAEQLAAIVAFAAKHGRTWKSVLLSKWANGGDDREPAGGLLRQIRNTFGPSWLEKFRLPEAAPEQLSVNGPRVRVQGDIVPSPPKDAFAEYPDGARVEYHAVMAAGGRSWLFAVVTGRTATRLHVAIGPVANVHTFSLTEADVKRYLRPQPRCMVTMGCLCAGHARGNDTRGACDTSETPSTGACEVCGRDDVPLQPDGKLANHDSGDAVLDEFEACAGTGQVPSKPSQPSQPSSFVVTRASQLCDACSERLMQQDGVDDYITDDEVCQGSDDPGFRLCGRDACRPSYELPIEQRRKLYAEGRARNEATVRASKRSRLFVVLDIKGDRRDEVEGAYEVVDNILDNGTLQDEISEYHLTVESAVVRGPAQLITDEAVERALDAFNSRSGSQVADPDDRGPLFRAMKAALVAALTTEAVS